MSGKLVVLTGVHTGRRITLADREITLGRKAEADLQFDPDQELAVSGIHASVFPTKEGWAIRDLDSMNGTLVDGELISGSVLLRDGNRIQVGKGGPVVEFRWISPEPGSPPDLDSPAPDPIPEQRPSEKKGLWLAVSVLSVALVGMILMVLQTTREGRLYREEARAMQETIDSILEASESGVVALEGRIQGLGDALQESRGTLQGVRTELEAAQESGDTQEVQALRVQLQEAQTALVRQQLAANLDYEVIEGANRRAVAKVFVDFGEEVLTATAFAVRPDGTLLTCRHVVAGPAGDRRPVRLAVQFADSRQVWPARILTTAPADDLAVLKVDNILGDVPVISGFNTNQRSVSPGQAVAVIGFPLGGASGGDDGEEDLARAVLTAGVVSALSPETLEVNGYGLEGSSGSPIFNNEGKVVGVLFGGRIDGGDRVLYAVPANRVAAFLNQVR